LFSHPNPLSLELESQFSIETLSKIVRSLMTSLILESKPLLFCWKLDSDHLTYKKILKCNTLVIWGLPILLVEMEFQRWAGIFLSFKSFCTLAIRIPF
jgi:hypothetical protein